jgi:4'-phosphopantetheinyl transferase
MVDAVPAPGSLAVPRPEEIQVWWTRLEPGSLGEATRTRLATDVDPGTLRRVQRYLRPADRDRALAGHVLLRRVLAAVAGGQPAELELGVRCGHCGSTEHGKPFLRTGAEPLVEVNLSHSGPVVCVALAGPGAGVGIDVEARRGVDWPTLRRSVFADSEWTVTEQAAAPERSRTDAWARKEASVKSCGWGLSMPLAEVVVTADGRDQSAGWRAELTDGMGTAHGHDVDMGDDVAAAVAVHRPAGPRPMVSPVVRFVTRL